MIEGIIEIPELVEIEHLGFVIAHAADDRREIGRWPSLASPKAGSGSVIMMRLKPSDLGRRKVQKADSALNSLGSA